MLPLCRNGMCECVARIASRWCLWVNLQFGVCPNKGDLFDLVKRRAPPTLRYAPILHTDTDLYLLHKTAKQHQNNLLYFTCLCNS